MTPAVHTTHHFRREMALKRKMSKIRVERKNPMRFSIKGYAAVTRKVKNTFSQAFRETQKDTLG
jgi:phage head maturation protease